MTDRLVRARWLVRAMMARQQRMIRAIEQQQAAIEMQYQTENDARGWFYDGEDITAVPDVYYPPDPQVIRLIREIIPDVQPVTVRTHWSQSWMEGYARMTLVRNCIARTVRDVMLPPIPFDCAMPPVQDWRLPLTQPNFLEFHHYDSADRPYGADRPGKYLAIDFDLVTSMSDALRLGRSVREVHEERYGKIRRHREELLKQRDRESSYWEKEENARLAKLLPQFSEREVIDYLLGDRPEQAPAPFMATVSTPDSGPGTEAPASPAAQPQTGA